VVWFAERGATASARCAWRPTGRCAPASTSPAAVTCRWRRHRRRRRGLVLRGGRQPHRPLTQDTSRPWSVPAVRLATTTSQLRHRRGPVLARAGSDVGAARRALDRHGGCGSPRPRRPSSGCSTRTGAREHDGRLCARSTCIERLRRPSIPADLTVRPLRHRLLGRRVRRHRGVVREDGAGRCATARASGPRAQSLTDAPMVTDGGDCGSPRRAAAQLTRVQGVSAGRGARRRHRPGDRHRPRDGDREGLREMTSVERPRGSATGATAGRADGLEVGGGGFALGAGGTAWDRRPAGGLRPGDRVTLTPHGPSRPCASPSPCPSCPRRWARAVA
jgi:hypothetical protein